MKRLPDDVLARHRGASVQRTRHRQRLRQTRQAPIGMVGRGYKATHRRDANLHRACVGATTVKMEWLRAGDNHPAAWACFLIFDDHVDVLAIIGAKERVDGTMTTAAANYGGICESAAGTAR